MALDTYAELRRLAIDHPDVSIQFCMFCRVRVADFLSLTANGPLRSDSLTVLTARLSALDNYNIEWVIDWPQDEIVQVYVKRREAGRRLGDISISVARTLFAPSEVKKVQLFLDYAKIQAAF